MKAFIIGAIIWIIVCNFSFYCSKFTTISKYGWFARLIFCLEDFADKKLKSKRLSIWILNFSFSKTFCCRQCHAFWISFLILYFALGIESKTYAALSAFLLAYLIYLAVQNKLWHDAKAQNKGGTC